MHMVVCAQSQMILRVQDRRIEAHHLAKEMAKKKRAAISKFKFGCTVYDLLPSPSIIPWPM